MARSNGLAEVLSDCTAARAALATSASPSHATASSINAAESGAVTPSKRRRAAAISSSRWASARCLVFNVVTSEVNWLSVATPASARNAVSRGDSAFDSPRGRTDASKTSRASVIASAASRSSASWKWGEISASSGKRRSNDWQKAWIVLIRTPPGRSSTVANNDRARSILLAVGSTASPRSSRVSASWSNVTQPPRRRCSRTDISAAAALVNVRQRMRSGFAPSTINRSSRSVRSRVLPDPAEAATKADTRGSEAASWLASASARGEVMAPPPRPPSPIPPRAPVARSRRSGASRTDRVARGNNDPVRRTAR